MHPKEVPQRASRTHQSAATLPSPSDLKQRLRVFWITRTPPEVFVDSFVLLVALGTLGFMTLPGLSGLARSLAAGRDTNLRRFAEID